MTRVAYRPVPSIISIEKEPFVRGTKCVKTKKPLYEIDRKDVPANTIFRTIEYYNNDHEKFINVHYLLSN